MTNRWFAISTTVLRIWRWYLWRPTITGKKWYHLLVSMPLSKRWLLEGATFWKWKRGREHGNLALGPFRLIRRS